ncbi:hypothetical protein NC651_006468 [Populus alba x Populus x berolinensis]|nr:hypothetical protein NC651_006468 [Populus alba x Populus x berolinensis]
MQCNITTSYLYQRLRYNHFWKAAWLLLLHMWLPWSLPSRQKVDILVIPATSNLSPAASPSSASPLYFSNLSWTLGVLGFCLLGFAY